MKLLRKLIRRAGPVAVISPTGELRRGAATFFIQALDLALDTDASVIVVSLEAVTAIMSEGIRSLVIGHDKAGKAGKRFYLTDLSATVNYALKITNLLDFLNHTETLDSILAEHSLARADLAPLKAEAPAAGGDTAPQKKGLVMPELPRVKPASPVRDERRQPPLPPPVPRAKPTGSEKAEPPPRPSPAPSGKRPSERKVKKAEASETAQPEISLDEKQMEKLIRRHIPGRMAVKILEFFVLKHQDVAAVKTIAKAIGESEKSVRKIGKEMIARGVLKELGQDVYNYGPEFDLGEQIQYFLREWHKPARHSRLLGILLSLEK